MRVTMTNKRFAAPANVLREDVKKWEAAGWVAARKPKKTTPKEKDDK